jgi:glutamate racemase
MTQVPAPVHAPIGVFDSGVGGLSVLRHIRAQLPHEDLLYFADSAFAPYGDKTESEVIERSLAITRFLLAQGIKALVVACNTATVAAIRTLRETWPHMPIIGVEPGLKPAAAATRNGLVGVMATDRTLAGDKFLKLRDQITASSNARFLLQGCTGLADQIELGETDSGPTRALLEKYLLPLLDQGADTVVLGCTHYPFVQATIEDIIQQAAPGRDVTLVDTGDAVARHLTNLLGQNGLGSQPRAAQLTGYTSASAAALSAAFGSLLGWNPPVREVQADAQGTLRVRAESGLC